MLGVRGQIFWERTTQSQGIPIQDHVVDGKIQIVVAPLNIGNVNVEMKFSVPQKCSLGDDCRPQKFLSTTHGLAVIFVDGLVRLLTGHPAVKDWQGIAGSVFWCASAPRAPPLRLIPAIRTTAGR